MQLEVLEARQMLAAVAQTEPVTLELLGRYETHIFDQSAAEIVTHDPNSQRLFITNSAADVDLPSQGRGGIDVLDIHDPAKPTRQMTIDTTPFGDVPTSVDVHGGLLAIAVRQVDPVTDNGHVALFDVRQPAPRWLGTIEVGPYPDNMARGLGYQNHQLPGNGLDANDKDNRIHISAQPVKGMYQPDGIAAFAVGDQLWSGSAVSWFTT